MVKNAIVMKTVDYIEDNLDGELTLDIIANEMLYSKFHLNRLFSEEVGCTIHKYIQMRRLTESAEKLVNTDKPIVQIAFEAHYNSQQSFTFAFRELYVFTPQEYRVKRTFTPKRSRFTMNKNFTMIHKSIASYEAMAA